MRCADSDRRERSMTGAPQGEPPGRCAICGKVVVTGDLAPELAHAPEPARLPIHAACFQSYLKESRARGDAWARSARGRGALGWLRIRLIATVMAATILTIVAAGPIAIAVAVRGKRLRRAVCSTLPDESRAAVIVGYRPNSAGAAEVRDVFSAAWGEGAAVLVLLVDIDAPLGPTDLAGAAWQHWGNNPKPPRQPSVVVVPRHGEVRCFRIGHSPAGTGTPWRDRLIQIREQVGVSNGV